MTVYRSKADAWLVAVIAVSAIASLVAAIAFLAEAAPAAWAFASMSAGVGAGLPIWILVSTRYTLGEGQLLVKSGPFTWRVPLADITRVTPTSNPLSSPALSLDRLRVEYGRGGWVMISPRDKAAFICDLEAAGVPRVEVDASEH